MLAASPDKRTQDAVRIRDTAKEPAVTIEETIIGPMTILTIRDTVNTKPRKDLLSKYT
jgi:hypothetical protein